MIEKIKDKLLKLHKLADRCGGDDYGIQDTIISILEDVVEHLETVNKPVFVQSVFEPYIRDVIHPFSRETP